MNFTVILLSDQASSFAQLLYPGSCFDLVSERVTSPADAITVVGIAQA
jgi:hypothetical protein